MSGGDSNLSTDGHTGSLPRRAAGPTLPAQLDFGWQMRGLETARTTLTFRRGGAMELTIDHAPLRGVSPAMLRWWFGGVHLGMVYQGRRFPRYRVWHPRDHIALDKPRLDGNGLAGEGAHFHIREGFGRDGHFQVDSNECVEKLDDSGLRLLKVVAGVRVFSPEHWFSILPGATRYESQMVVGASSPLLGRVLNPLLTTRVFPEPMRRAWLRHNVEEIGNFELFLPDPWAQEAGER